jgi:hypothetical protein
MIASRELLVTPLVGIKTKRQLWAYKDIVPLNVATILAGTGGIGKSTILSWLTAGLTTGTLEGDFYGKPVSVGFISGEDDLSTTLVPRLQAAGANLDLIQDFSGVRSVDSNGNAWTGLPTIADDLQALKTALQEWGTKVLIIDPVMSIMSGDSIKASDVRRNLDPIAALASDLGIAPIMVMHFGKGQGNASDKVSGSHAFRDIARSVLLLAVDDETDQRILTVDKSNYSQRSASLAFTVESAEVPTDDGEIATVGRARLLGETTLTVHELVNREKDDSLGNDSGDILAFVNSSDADVTTLEVASEMDMTKDKARTYLNRLVNSERIQRAARGRYTRNTPISSVSSVSSVSSNHPDSTHSTDSTADTDGKGVLNASGTCPKCGLGSHPANERFSFVHPGCDVAQ